MHSVDVPQSAPQRPQEATTSQEKPKPVDLDYLTGSILVVDDDESVCELIHHQLARRDLNVLWCTSPYEALDLVSERDFDLIISDLSMSGMTGLELAERIIGTRPHTPVILITGHGSMEAAVAAMRVGTYDFITKPIDQQLLALSVIRAFKHRRLGEEVRRLRQRIFDRARFQTIVGQSPAVKQMLELISRVADSDASVLITGESGTGKELIAHALHDQGSRRTGPFLAINCAAVPPTLIESELFGHVRGAFTDAKADRRGLFVEARGGTLFLDEIGDLPIEVQSKLLRALQERKVRPVGGTKEVPFDARIIAATNRDLESDVKQRRFREDLYYRINVVCVHVPPLRDRGGDVLVLAQTFVSRFCERTGKTVRGLSPAAQEKLRAYDWPGNVRELEHCIERAVALTRSEEISAEDLPERIRTFHPQRIVLAAEDASQLVTVDELERRYVMRVLGLVGGNKSRAAEVLGFDRRTLYRKLERYRTLNATT
jgi:DNA-binding NtrC family response regulator